MLHDQHRTLPVALRSFLLLAIVHQATGAGYRHVRADETQPGKFKGYARVEKNLSHATVVSEDKRVATLLFDNFVTTAYGKGNHLVATQTQTFVVPVESDPTRETRIGLQIRGFLSTAGSARASLIVRAGGKTRVVDLEEAIIMAQRNLWIRQTSVSAQPNDAKSSGATEEQRNKARDAAKQLVPASAAEAVSDSFLFDMAYKVPPNSKNPITVMVVVDRDFDGSEDQGYLVIDSLDISVTDPIPQPSAPAKSPS
jgi:hypothetical protein